MPEWMLRTKMLNRKQICPHLALSRPSLPRGEKVPRSNTDVLAVRPVASFSPKGRESSSIEHRRFGCAVRLVLLSQGERKFRDRTQTFWLCGPSRPSFPRGEKVPRTNTDVLAVRSVSSFSPKGRESSAIEPRRFGCAARRVLLSQGERKFRERTQTFWLF